MYLCSANDADYDEMTPVTQTDTVPAGSETKKPDMVSKPHQGPTNNEPSTEDGTSYLQFIQAIQDFLTPTSSTDVYDWFCLLYQVANPIMMGPNMDPLQHLVDTGESFT
jgi:hypothetical protein